MTGKGEGEMNGKMYVGTKDGVLVYDPETEEWSPVKPKSGDAGPVAWSTQAMVICGGGEVSRLPLDMARG